MSAVRIEIVRGGVVVCGHRVIIGNPCRECDALAENELLWWTSSSGRIEFQMTRRQAESVSHSGDCYADVIAVLPELAMTLAKIEPATLAAELKEYGAWSAEDLADHKENLTRLIWLAGNDITEGH